MAKQFYEKGSFWLIVLAVIGGIFLLNYLVQFLTGLLIVSLVLAMIVLWIITLIRQAKRGEWVWFVLTLIFNITWIIYWIYQWVK